MALKRWGAPTHPKRIKNPLQAVIAFARYMGMTHIPKRTIEKLRTDPVFRYCFYLLIRDHTSVYVSSTGKETRTQLKNILEDPDLVTDKNIFEGLIIYLDHFIGYLPGGRFYVAHERDPLLLGAEVDQIIKAVKSVLEEQESTEKAAGLRADYFEEDGTGVYKKRAEFLTFALEIFKILVGRDQFNPEAIL